MLKLRHMWISEHSLFQKVRNQLNIHLGENHDYFLSCIYRLILEKSQEKCKSSSLKQETKKKVINNLNTCKKVRASIHKMRDWKKSWPRVGKDTGNGSTWQRSPIQVKEILLICQRDRQLNQEMGKNYEQALPQEVQETHANTKVLV